MPPVPEEDDMFRNSSLNANYSDLDLMTPITQMNEINEDPTIKNEQSPQQQQTLAQEAQNANMQNLHYTAKIYTQPQPESSSVYRNSMWVGNSHFLFIIFLYLRYTHQSYIDAIYVVIYSHLCKSNSYMMIRIR